MCQVWPVRFIGACSSKRMKLPLTPGKLTLFAGAWWEGWSVDEGQRYRTSTQGVDKQIWKWMEWIEGFGSRWDRRKRCCSYQQQPQTPHNTPSQTNSTYHQGLTGFMPTNHPTPIRITSTATSWDAFIIEKSKSWSRSKETQASFGNTRLNMAYWLTKPTKPTHGLSN